MGLPKRPEMEYEDLVVEQEVQIPFDPDADIQNRTDSPGRSHPKSAIPNNVIEDKTPIPYGGIISGNSSNRSSVNESIELGHRVNATDYFGTLSQTITNSFIFIICLGGLVGNGMVIWLLGFYITSTSNSFTTYILNLCIADFEVLVCLLGTAIFGFGITLYGPIDLLYLFSTLFIFTYYARQFLLAAISLESCTAVLFPLWHRCHRPPYLPALVCPLIWALSFLLSDIHFSLLQTTSFRHSPLPYQSILNVLFYTAVMVISTLTLFIHFCCKTNQCQRGKLITSILLVLLVSFILSLPLNVIGIIYFCVHPPRKLMLVGFACSSLNSSLNPLIYFLIGGKQKNGQYKVTMKDALQMVFKEEGDNFGRRTT
uniref:Mas-related G-protein coupled receptor member A1-like n=1 Tax=Pogona vitticeps TaxID=103695 RepID=A0ABM5GDE4_9SAUR